MIKDAPRTTRIVTGWRAACLFTLTISGAMYLPAMSGLPIWDDHALISGSGIGGGKSVAACFSEPFLLHYFRPLVSVSFFLDHKLSGSGPFFYHQTNLLIHVITTLLCIVLFRAAFGSRLIAVAGALAFAVQPAQVSTVAWIGGRTDSLCTMWLTLFAWALIRSAQTHSLQRGGWTALSTVGFGLALFTKEQAIGMLPLVPLAHCFFASTARKAAWRDGLRCSIPYVVTGAAFIAAWLAVYPAPHPPVMHGLAEQAALAGRTLTYYTALLAAPTPGGLHLLSVGTLERWGLWSILPGYAVLGAMVLFCIRGFRGHPGAAWFCAFVVLGMLPVSNLIPLPSLVVAPYRVGMCGPGVAALLAYLFVHGYRRAVSAASLRSIESAAVGTPPLPGRPKSRRSSVALARTGMAAGGLLLLWCAGLTWWGAGRWQDERMIFATIVRYDPDSIVARFNLTTALLKLHRSGPALVELDQLMTRLFRSREWLDQKMALAALERDPRILVRIRENQGNTIRPELWLAALYGQRGFALLDARDREGARRSFAVGLAIERSNDDVNLGIAQMEYDAGRYRKAAGYLRVVVAGHPRRAEAHMLLGHTLAAMGRWRAARAELETWASLQPWCGQAQVEVAQANCRLGDYAGAQARLQYALSNSICDVEEVRARLRDLHGRASRFLN